MKTVKVYKDWIDTYENPTESEKELIDGFKDILDEIFINNQKALDEKDKLIKSQAYDCSEYLKIIKRNADERQTQLKKSDFHIWCKNCKKTLKTRLDRHCGYSPDVTISIISHSKYESLED